MSFSASRPVRVAVEWDSSVITEKVLRKPGVITVGDAGSDLLVPGVAAPLEVRISGKAATLIVPGDWVGTVVLAGKPMNPADAGRAIELGPEDSARLQPSIGSRVVVAVERAECFVAAGAKRRDWALSEALLLALVLHSTLLLVTTMQAPLARPDRPQRIEQRSARFILKRPEEKGPEEKKAESTPSVDKSADKRLLAEKPLNAADRQQALEQRMRNRGVLRALSAGSVMDRLFSATTDQKLENALARLEGDQMRAVVDDGSGAASTRGSGGSVGTVGGGGTGPLGGAQYDAASLPGVAQAAGVRAEIGKRGERRARADLSYGSSDVEGSLTQKQIEVVIRAHASGIKYCYESELVRFPKLEGKVTAKWWIDAEGQVFRAVVDSSTVGNAGLEECVLRQIKRWQFPRPGGGNVVVRFPFIFKGVL